MLHKKPNGICSEMMEKVKSIADSIIQIRLDTGESLALALQINSTWITIVSITCSCPNAE